MLTTLAFLIPSVLAAGLLAYLIVGIIIYLYNLYRSEGVRIKSATLDGKIFRKQTDALA
ncbi:MAG TPA: hypothetical protein VF658_04465 [Pyrinomonadaceae bacterium]|jgi:hypothetical protein